MSEPDAQVADGDGGASGSGGTSTSSSGSPSHGASANEAGTPATGARPGTGGSDDGSAGEPTMSVGGSGAATGQGGEPGGGAAGAPPEPVAGNGNGGTGSVEVDPCDGSDKAACVDVIAGEAGTLGAPFKSSWFLVGCQQKQVHDCFHTSSCPSGGIKWTQSFPIGGQIGASYSITFDFRGLAEARAYTGGTYNGAIGADPNVDTNDGFYIGGSPPASNYDVWQLRVKNAQGAELQHYYLNAFPSSGYEAHRTYLLSYTKSILVVGGGTVELEWADANCHSIDNCNAGEVIGTTCTTPRKLPSPDQNLQVPATFIDPVDGQTKGFAALSAAYNPATRAQPWHSQLGHLTVTAAEFAGN